MHFDQFICIETPIPSFNSLLHFLSWKKVWNILHAPCRGYIFVFKILWRTFMKNACLNELHINDTFVEQYLYYRSNPSNQGYIQSHTIHSHYYNLHTFQCISPNSLGQNIHEGKLYQQKIIITFINQNNIYYLLLFFSIWLLDSIFHIHFLCIFVGNYVG